MDLDTAHALLADAKEPEGALASAMREADPGSLGAAERLRRRFPADLAAAALGQAELRRRARTKFGDRASDLLFTREGLEQATRASVARWRAARYVELGVTSVADLGCGLGADALALQAAGLTVSAVDKDPVTALFAGHNLGIGVDVGDAESTFLAPGQGFFIDPARRDASGRTWSVEQLTPSWDFVRELLSTRTGCAKVGPGIAHNVIPADVVAEWISDGGDVVEAGLWSGMGSGYAATKLPTGERIVADDSPTPDVGPIGNYLLEPDGAALRARCLPRLALQTGATLVAPNIAYLTCDERPTSTWLTSFRVDDVLPYKTSILKKYVREHGIGTLEIKKRGVDVDPAVLRKSLQPKGKATSTLILTPTPDGVRAIVGRRV